MRYFSRDGPVHGSSAICLGMVILRINSIMQATRFWWARLPSQFLKLMRGLRLHSLQCEPDWCSPSWLYTIYTPWEPSHDIDVSTAPEHILKSRLCLRNGWLLLLDFFVVDLELHISDYTYLKDACSVEESILLQIQVFISLPFRTGARVWLTTNFVILSLLWQHFVPKTKLRWIADKHDIRYLCRAAPSRTMLGWHIHRCEGKMVWVVTIQIVFDIVRCINQHEIHTLFKGLFMPKLKLTNERKESSLYSDPKNYIPSLK